MGYVKGEKKAVQYKLFLLDKIGKMFDKKVIGDKLEEKYGNKYLKDIENLTHYLEYEEGFVEHENKNESIWYKKFGDVYVKVNLELEKPHYNSNNIFYHRSLNIIISVSRFI